MVDYLDEFKLFLNEDNGDNGNNDNNNNVKKFVEDKEIYEIVDNESVFTINSKDRNLINETAFDFSINFGTNNPNKINIDKNFKNIVEVEFIGLIIPDFYVDIKELLTLQKKDLINNTTKPLRLKRISDLPYLLLNISELKNTDLLGSDQTINNSSFVLVIDEVREMTDNNSGTLTVNGATFTENGNIDQTIIGETVKRNLYFKNFINSSIKYSSPQNYIGNIQVSLRTPQGELLSNLNDFLEVYRVYKFGDGSDIGEPYRLRIKFYNFFTADEYRVGDRILFKGLGYPPVDESLLYNEETVRNNIISLGYTSEIEIQSLIPSYKNLYNNNGFTNPNYLDRYADIIQFLERKEGHTILEVAGNNSENPKLFTEIGIPFDSQIPLDTESNSTGQITINDLDLPNTPSGILKESITGSGNNMVLTLSTCLNHEIGTYPITQNDIIDCVGIDKGNTRKLNVSLKNLATISRSVNTTVVDARDENGDEFFAAFQDFAEIGFSQSLEGEADIRGAQIISELGYDFTQGIEVIRRLEKITSRQHGTGYPNNRQELLRKGAQGEAISAEVVEIRKQRYGVAIYK